LKKDREKFGRKRFSIYICRANLTEMMAIYVAGKLNDTDAVRYLHNVHKMMETAEQVRLAGHAPFVPAIDLLMGIKFGYENYEDYFNASQIWLAKADAVVLVSGWETSPGTKKEIATAHKLGIPVLDDISKLNESD
jgi:hypothetical protein